MIELDVLIYKLGFAGLIISCVRWQAFPAAFFLCLSFIINEWLFIKDPNWSELSKLYFMYAAKDFAIAVVFGFRIKTTEFILSMTFMASCLFHLVAQIETYNHTLGLIFVRTEFMTYITVAQLATMYLIILTGSGSNGGKRAKHWLFNSYYRLDNIFHRSACKVKE